MIGNKLGGRYEVLREVGRGGMGVVYLARDTVLEREVAVKLIGAQNINDHVRQRFLREARVIARLDHPAVLPVYDLGEHEHGLFFVMPYVEGSTLRDLLAGKKLSLNDTLALVAQVAGGLEHGHQQGIVHRDVKPENILVDQGPNGLRARLSDFGIALTQADERLTRTGALVGTPHYISPEQVSSAPVDGRADVYALGVVLYECLIGQPPFVGPLPSVLYRIVHETPKRLREIGCIVDGELEALVMACMAKEPALRPQTAGELEASLERYRSSINSLARTQEMLAAIHSLVPPGITVAPLSRPLIGRERELREMCRALDAAVAGSCQVALVAGDAGVGKRRLLEEVERLAAARGVRVFHGDVAERGQSYPYQGFGEIIAQCCRSTATGTVAGPDFSDLAPELVRIFPVLEEVPGLGVTETGPPEPEPAWERTRIFELLARSLGRVASVGPVMFVLTRLHDADVSLDALQYVSRRLAAQPVFIVGTYVSSEIGASHPVTQLLDGFRGSRRFTLLELAGLSTSDYAALVETLLPGRASAALLARLYSLTQGNPYFTVELARSLLDAGSIVEGADGLWTASGADTISADAIPDTIQKAVELRLSRLSDSEQDTLRTASVLGAAFDYRELEALSKDTDVLDRDVEALVRGEFVTEERHGRVDRLVFSSELLHGVVYSALPRRTRRRLHARAAEAVESIHRGRPKAVLARLLVHYSEADDAEAVRGLGLELGHDSLAAFAVEDAISAARKVLAFTDDEAPEAARAEGEAYAVLSAAHRLKGELENALRDIESAVRAFRRAGLDRRLNDVLVDGVKIAYEARRFAETEHWLERALAELRKADDRRLEELLMIAATVANLRGDTETAHEAAREAERLRSDAPGESAAAGGILRVAHASRQGVLDDAGWTRVAGIESSACAFETLITLDEWGNATPRLAESWEANAESTRFTFTLREGIQLHDGRVLGAADVAQSFEHSIRGAGSDLRRVFGYLLGVDDFVTGKAEHVRGIQVEGERRLVLELDQPLAAYPLSLTERRAAVACPSSADASKLVGTGPFELTDAAGGSLVIKRCMRHFSGAPKLEHIEFVHLSDSDDVADAFRSGRIDVAMDLPVEHLERLLSDRRLGARLVDVDRKMARMAVFNTTRPLGANPAVRRALFESIPIEAMAWHHAGACAQPAFTLIPAGLPGHDSSRRRKRLTLDEVRALLTEDIPRTLSVAAAPVLYARFRNLFDATFDRWREIGFEVAVEICSDSDYVRRWADPTGVDILICAWIGDDADAANFTEDLFHSKTGALSAYHHSDDLDLTLARARREPSAERRAALYRSVDRTLVDSCIVLPMLSGNDPCVVRAEVRGLEPRALCPYLSYEKAFVRRSASHRSRRGWLVVPIIGQITEFDPVRAWTEFDVFHCCFEGLTAESRGAKVVPRLAESVESEDDGSTYRVRLRDHLRFHDGRKVTAWHVRASWERALRSGSELSARVLRFITGAERVTAGEDAELSGVHVTSSLELTIELARPTPQFRAMLGDLSTVVLADVLDASQRERGIKHVGTGPFRLKGFDPGRRIELEANPYYWRAGYPKCDGITFLMDVANDEAHRRLLADQVSLVCDEFLGPGTPGGGDIVTLDAPVLATAALIFNTRSATFRHLANRRAVADSFDPIALGREHLTNQMLPARSYLPPGLLGHAPAPVERGTAARSPHIEGQIRCCMMRGLAQFPAYSQALLAAISKTGLSVEVSSQTSEIDESMDILVGAWMADYPDADSMVRGALHSRDGLWGRLIGHPEIDRVCEQAAFERDPALRRSLYQRIEELLREHCLLVPLFHPTLRWLSRPSVKGLNADNVGLTRGIDFSELWLDR